MLLAALAGEAWVERLAGIDTDGNALALARQRLEDEFGEKAAAISLVHASIVEPVAAMEAFDAAVLVETIEHLDPARLQRLERTVFAEMAPGTAIVTTPNSEYNELLGVPAHRMRHPDHRFEWDRERFRAWCGGVGRRNGYTARFRDVPEGQPRRGGPTQMAVFTRA